MEGIIDWSKARQYKDGPFSIYHSHAYRRPEGFAGKVS